jgi:predicted nucleotidyltransferase
MDIRNKKICDRAATEVRDMLRTFNDLEVNFEIRDGRPVYEQKQLSQEFISKNLNLPHAGSSKLLECLIREGFIDGKKLTPTTEGMALIAVEDRERIGRREAENILQDFLRAVECVNSRQKARIFVEKAYVFGGYEAGSDSLGDIDLLLEIPLPDECIPEDMTERDWVCEEINVSDYLSFHDEFDLVAAKANKKLIYDRAVGICQQP